LVIKDADESNGTFKGGMEQFIDRNGYKFEEIDGTFRYTQRPPAPYITMTVRGNLRNKPRNFSIAEAFAGSTEQPDYSVLKLNGGYAFYNNGRATEKALSGDFIKQN
ncbi:MAG: hypothetical protein F6K44_21340, partial [Moorea sp. SIO3E2]|nr:hypothetical protein [Moorena sp. SIO3E2]